MQQISLASVDVYVVLYLHCNLSHDLEVYYCSNLLDNKGVLQLSDIEAGLMSPKPGHHIPMASRLLSKLKRALTRRRDSTGPTAHLPVFITLHVLAQVVDVAPFHYMNGLMVKGATCQ